MRYMILAHKRENSMHIAILTFEGFNELDSLIWHRNTLQLGSSRAPKERTLQGCAALCGAGWREGSLRQPRNE